jgi:hypothetical protein
MVNKEKIGLLTDLSQEIFCYNGTNQYIGNVQARPGAVTHAAQKLKDISGTPTYRNGAIVRAKFVGGLDINKP